VKFLIFTFQDTSTLAHWTRTYLYQLCYAPWFVFIDQYSHAMTLRNCGQNILLFQYTVSITQIQNQLPTVRITAHWSLTSATAYYILSIIIC